MLLCIYMIEKLLAYWRKLMSSAKWRPSKGGWGIFGSDENSEYGKVRREGFSSHAEKGQYGSLKGSLTSSISQMSKQMEALDTFTEEEKERAGNALDRAERAKKRAEGAFNRAGDKKAMGLARAGMQMANAGTTASLASAQNQIAGKQAANKIGQQSNQMAAASGIESMGQVQAQHEQALKDAYAQSAISNIQAGMQQRTSQFGAMETAFGAQQAYDDAGDRWGAAQDTYEQAEDTKNAQIGQATLNQANALASMAKDISSMTTAFTQATEKTYSSAELNALMDDLQGG